MGHVDLAATQDISRDFCSYFRVSLTLKVPSIPHFSVTCAGPGHNPVDILSRGYKVGVQSFLLYCSSVFNLTIL